MTLSVYCQLSKIADEVVRMQFDELNGARTRHLNPDCLSRSLRESQVHWNK